MIWPMRKGYLSHTQTAKPQASLHKQCRPRSDGSFIDCPSFCIFSTHYCFIVKVHCSNFRIVTAIFSSSVHFFIFTVTFRIRDRDSPALSVEELETEILLDKEWTSQRIKLHMEELKTIKRLVRAQERALQKLREESEELYQQAIEVCQICKCS